MRQLALCALALGLSGVLCAQDKPVLRAELTPVEVPPPPPPLKVALVGKALAKYRQARDTAMQYLASPACSRFLKAHFFDPQQVSRALAAQQPQDGAASEISRGSAGIAASGDREADVAINREFKNPRFLTMAVSQPRGVDTYYNPEFFEHKNRYPYSLPVSVIHEALHNLTGENDVAIAQDFGYNGFEPLEANIYVNKSLKKYCDSRR